MNDKTVLSKKFLGTSIAMAMTSMLIFVPNQGEASTIQVYDSDTANTFIKLDKLNFSTDTALYSATVNLGADKTLDAGDTVSETFSMTSTGSTLGINPLDFGLAGDYRVSLTLNGVIGSVTGTGITLNNDNLYDTGLDSLSGLNTTTFDVGFNSATITFSNLDNSVNVATLTLTGGGVSDVQLVAGQLLNTTTVNANLDTSALPFTAVGDSYILDEIGNSLIGRLVGTITTGSTRIQTVLQAQQFTGLTNIAPIYGDFDAGLMTVGFFDNGLASTFEITLVPEPASLALIGLGLLGFGVARKAKKST